MSPDRPWKKSESGKLWNLYLAGKGSERIAAKLERNPKDVLRRIEQLGSNEHDLAIRYKPFRRMSRKGLLFSENEKLIIEEHKERKVPLKATAKLLCRDVSEINEDWKQVPEAKANTAIAPSLDLVMAHRYIFHVYKTPIISNKSYDDLYKEEIEYGGGRKALTEISKHGFWGPPRIKSLSLYLLQKYEDEHGKPPVKITKRKEV